MPSRRRRVREALMRELSGATDLPGVVRAADGVLRAALAAEGSAWGTVDPASTLSTSCSRFGELDTGPAGWSIAAARERRLFELEWADDDPHTFWELARAGLAAAALRITVADPRHVRRYQEVLAPSGAHDELRLRLTVDGEEWATAIFYRFRPRPFSADDVAVAAGVAPLVARAVRTALLRAVCDDTRIDAPPGSLLLGSGGEVLVSSAAADELLGALADTQVATVLGNLRSATLAHGVASLTVTAPGAVLTLHGSRAKGVDGAVAAVVERPRTVQLAPLIMRAAGFTQREREVAEGLLHGTARTPLARRLGMSEHTLGEHVRNVYRKCGVSGRSELAALLYGRHYETPRSTGAQPSPYGYFVGDAPQGVRPPPAAPVA